MAGAVIQEGPGGQTQAWFRENTVKAVCFTPERPLDFDHLASILGFWLVGFRFSRIETSKVIEPPNREFKCGGQRRGPLSRGDSFGQGP